MRLVSRSKAQHAFDALFRRPYWTRAWIIQEIVLAKRATIYCGADSISLDTIMIALHRNLSGLGLLNTCKIHNFAVLRTAYAYGKLPPLIHWSYITRKSKTSNLRDKVYALLNLAFDGRELVPHLDYKKTEKPSFMNLVVRFSS